MKKAVVSDELWETSGDERSRGVYENVGVGVDIASETETERGGLDRNRRGRVFRERAVHLNTTSSSRTENMEAFIGSDRRRKGGIMDSRSDRNGIGFYVDNRRPSRVPIDNWVPGNDGDFNMNGSHFVNSGLSNKHEEIRHQFDSLRLQPVMDQWSTERNGSNAFRGDARGISEHGRFTISTYPDEGPSNYPPSSLYGYGEHIRNHDGLDRLASVENLENDRAELLRKLDELKVQLSRSEKTKEPVAGDRSVARPLPDSHGGHEAFMPGGSNSLYNVNTRASPQENNDPNPPYYEGRIPYVKSHALDRQEFYPPPRDVPDEFVGYEDAYWPQRRPPHQYSSRSYHSRFPEQYMDFNQNSLMLQPRETFFHQPACSCFQCYNKNQQIPPEVTSTAFRSRRSPNDPTYPMYYNRVSPITHGAQGYNSRGFEPPQLHPRDWKPQTRSSSDFDSDNGAFNYRHPRKVVIASGGGERVCHPIVGGAPFITCCNCFELLKLPRKLVVMGKYQRKMRCGACSAINLFELENKGHLVPVSTQVNQVSAKVGDGSGEMFDKTAQSSPGYLNAGALDGFDKSGYDFQLADTDTNKLSGEKMLNFSEADKKQESRSSSSSFSDKKSPDSVIVRIDVTDSTELPSKDNVPLPLPDSPMNEHLDYSPSDNAVSRYGKGNKSERTDQEKVIAKQTTSRHNSVNDAPVATEIEVYSNEYVNSSVSLNSVELSKEEDQPWVNKESPSFFKGFMKKSFENFSRSSQSIEDGRSNVFVNGQLITERVVKKAEKLAGPIQPGEYWYDFRAGFWGVMGHPCLGIIPPFIEEFKYPMPESCGAGNTGVFVNGRELHRRDLDLLSSRGLPITRDKSYILEISGRVLDKDSGEELDSLGKLAPTVEKANRGFGMKIPKAIAP